MGNLSHQGHTPVLLDETLILLNAHPGDTVLDVTVGLGGHAEALLQEVGSTGTLIGIDADAKNLTVARERLSSFGNCVQLLQGNFHDLPDVLLLLRRDLTSSLQIWD